MTIDEQVCAVQQALRSKIEENRTTTERLFRSAKQLREAADMTRVQAITSAEVDVQLQAMYKTAFGT